MVRLLILCLRMAAKRGMLTFVLTAATLGFVDCVRAGETVQNYPLYYRLGGMRATDFAASEIDALRSLSAQRAPSGSVCGRFSRSTDVLDMLSARIEDSLTALSAVPEAISGALPGSILCRAKPGLCQLLQHYVVRAENRWNLSVEDCRRDFEGAARADSPHQDLLEASRTEVWQKEVERGASAAQAAQKAGTVQGCVTWLGGRRAGCREAEPIWLVHDTARAGWCLLMGKDGACDGSELSNTEANGQSPLLRVWPSPQEAGDWAVTVLGDYRIQAGEAIETIAGSGLLPHIDQLTDEFTQALTTRVYTPKLSAQELELPIDGANLVLALPLIGALRDLPDRDFLIKRLANEAALAETLEQAFLARRLLLSGMMEPHIHGAGGITQTVARQVTVLEREIDRANWEMQARRQMVSATVLEVLAAHRVVTTPAPAQRVKPKFLLR